MATFRKRPVEIQAVRWTGENVDEVGEFLGGWHGVPVVPDVSSRQLLVHTLEGRMRCAMGDWLIRGVEGEYYPCADSVFQKTYEEVLNGRRAAHS